MLLVSPGSTAQMSPHPSAHPPATAAVRRETAGRGAAALLGSSHNKPTGTLVCRHCPGPVESPWRVIGVAVFSGKALIYQVNDLPSKAFYHKKNSIHTHTPG